MDKLKEYLHDKRKGDFAKSLGTSPAYLSQLLSGYRRPSLDLMVKIEAATCGAVPISSWVIKNSECSASSTEAL